MNGTPWADRRATSGRGAVTRRRWLSAAGALGIAALARRRVAAQADAPSATPVGDDFPVTVEHALGQTTIPSPPRRVVVTNEHEALDSLLAIGLTPVLYAFSGGYDVGHAPWAIAAGADKLDFYETDNPFEPDVERLALADPDLILAAWLEGATYALLSALAPTVDVKGDEATTWREVQRIVGRATGRSDQAEQVIAATEAVLAEQGERLAPYAGRRVAVAYEWSDKFLINGETAPIGRELASFGLTVLSPETAPDGTIDTLSLEQIGIVADADIVISPEFVPASVASQEANPLVQAIPAVRQGNYMALPRELAQALYLESSLSMQWGIPRLVDAVIEAAEERGKSLAP